MNLPKHWWRPLALLFFVAGLSLIKIPTNYREYGTVAGAIMVSILAFIAFAKPEFFDPSKPTNDVENK